jgi:hypothetical protein
MGTCTFLSFELPVLLKLSFHPLIYFPEMEVHIPHLYGVDANAFTTEYNLSHCGCNAHDKTNSFTPFYTYFIGQEHTIMSSEYS